MDKISEFKNFVKKNPALVKFVNEDKMTWQKFYEMYNIYGEESEVWNEYLNSSTSVNTSMIAKTLGVSDIIGWLKNIDLDSLNENINSIQRVIEVIQELGNKESVSNYKPRPIYKHFED